MQLCKVRQADGSRLVGVLIDGAVRLLSPEQSLGAILEAEDPVASVRSQLTSASAATPIDPAQLIAPIDQQEVWAAGVTYKRSREARERESAGAARFYDLVYTAPRPELFFKATASRVVGPGGTVRIRRDSRWSVPEPELALVLSSRLRLVGYTIGNDMSARDIEGENPLYLPQAKIYHGSCSLGPAITLVAHLPPLDQVSIHLTIQRAGRAAFEGTTTLGAMARSFDDLIDWLGRENQFPNGVILLTGTGIVPPDDFSLQAGDEVSIEVTGIGRLSNPVQ
jgi:2-dehydro-3-deoxy-D-arabinonate dehydratase